MSATLLTTSLAVIWWGWIYDASVVAINDSKAKKFERAITPIAFVPNWKVGNYVEDRAFLNAYDVALNDYIKLPDVDDVNTSWNSYFTYMNMHLGAYLDEDREVGAGSHVGVDIRAPINTPIFSIGNGIVYKTKNLKNDKYVVVKHKDASYRGRVDDFYSAYLHLGEVKVKPGDLVNMGSVIGSVGMTGITSTPHLHFQVDRSNAPFHPYWPFTLSEAYKAGYDFYSAVNNGLNQLDIRKYSVDPMDFIKKAGPASGTPDTTKKIKKVKKKPKVEKVEKKEESTTIVEQEPTPNTIWGEEISNEIVGTDVINVEEELPTQEVKKTTQIVIKKEDKKVEKEKEETPQKKAGKAFPDLPQSHEYYNEIMHFVDQWVFSGYEDGTFGPENTLTRSEMLAVVLGALDIDNAGELLLGIFKDVPEDHWVNPLITTAVERGIISTERTKFHPDRPVTRAEFLAILAFASEIDFEKLARKSVKSWDDVDRDHWTHTYAAIAYRLQLFDDIDGDRFGINEPVRRDEVSHAMFEYLDQTGLID